MTVVVGRDWADWLLFAVQLLSFMGTAAAALLAYLTIQQAKTQARESQDALVLERRLDFELDVLKDLILSVNSIDALNLPGLAVMLPVSDIPLTWAAARLGSTSEAEQQLAALNIPPGSHPTVYVQELKDQLLTELRAAIQIRIEARADVKRSSNQRQGTGDGG